MATSRFWFVVAITTATVYGNVKMVTGDESSKLKVMMDNYWDWQMQTNPESSTYNGWHKYNDLSYSYSMAMYNITRDKALDFHSQLGAINRDQLGKADQVNYDILKDSLTTFLDGNKWAMYGSLSPINFLGGLHLQWCPPFATTKTRGDFENYIIRLAAANQQVTDIIEAGREAIRLGRTLHNVSLAKVPDQIDSNIFNNSEDSPCYRYLQQLLNSSNVVNETERDKVREGARNAISIYMDAFRTLKRFIVDEYMPNSRSEYGVYAWDPSGEYYKACVRWYLSFEITPKEVHETGLREVERITGEMKKIMSKLGFNGTVSEFFRSLEGNPKFYTNNTEKILQDYRSVVFDRINPKLSTVFKNIPDVPLEVVSSTSDGIGGGYSSASETRPGRFIINLYRPLELPSFEMMALSLHEANPGHHMQHSYSMFADLPAFRKDPLLAFSTIPNWIPYYSVYSEGWALYSEYLGEEMGLYKDEYEMMGRYSYEIMRACRLVVDTGLHYFNWTRESAIDYMIEHTALGPGSAAGEIDRYITWPGQALSYKLGEIKIRDLRATAEQQLGDRFDIKEFHLLLLQNGGMPLRMLETSVDDWIQMRRTMASRGTAVSAVYPGLVALTLVSQFYLILNI